jgi:hypothetical protein
MHDSRPFKAFARPLLQGADHILGRSLEVYSGAVLWGDDDLEQAGVARPLPLIRDGVERLLASRVKPFMFEPARLAGCALTLQISPVCLPSSLDAGIRIPNVYDRSSLKLRGRTPAISNGVSLA